MWNMSRKGFEKLYEKIPGLKLEFEYAWRLTGGNPDILAKLYLARLNIDQVVAELIRSKEITLSFTEKWRKWLEKAVEDPDTLWSADTPEELVRELTARNLIVYNMYDRDPWFWIDEPPPEKDPELGIGKQVAWQTPLHKEAVKRVLKKYSSGE